MESQELEKAREATFLVSNIEASQMLVVTMSSCVRHLIGRAPPGLPPVHSSHWSAQTGLALSAAVPKMLFI